MVGGMYNIECTTLGSSLAKRSRCFSVGLPTPQTDRPHMIRERCFRVLAFPHLKPTPPNSVMGHGLGGRAAKLRHGTVGFSCSFLFRPAVDAIYIYLVYIFKILGRMSNNKAEPPTLPHISYMSCFDLTHTLPLQQ